MTVLVVVILAIHSNYNCLCTSLMLLLLLSSSSLSSEGGRFGITGVAVGVALRGDVLLEVFGVNKRFKPEGPA